MLTLQSRIVRVALAVLVSAPALARSQAPVDPRLYAGLTWRNLGPFRGGRVAAVTGALGQPGVFYAGYPSAGVWKTTSAGATWYPVFDSIKEVSSVGAVEVAPSDPNVVYVGTGDLISGGAINEGNGVYKSTDAGRSWRHMGLDATKQIPSILVDLHDPNTLIIAAQGDVHVKSKSRGVFRSTDGGATWTQTLFVNDSTGLQKLARANDVPNTIFATTVLHYQPPPPPPGTPLPTPAQNLSATATMIYKSTDGGVTWTQLPGTGLPKLRNRTSIAVAMNTNAQRVFLVTIDGFYRSDDGGATWKAFAADDPRAKSGQNGYNCGVYVDPQNPDIVYVLNTSSYKSVDGGNTFTGFKGAPGGDDPQQLWIDPTNGKRMLMGVDQGATVTLDGGETWSPWYNQSTEQIYHLATDNSFPYWVYGTQQDAGAVRTRIRGNLGAITPLDWNTVSGWEWGTIRPDPLDPNTVYSSGSGIVKISYPSETWINVSPASDPARKLRTAFSQPIAFAPWNQHMLMAGFQSLWSTIDGGAHWTAMSPDLGVRSDAPPAPNGGPAPGGAIETIGASTIGAGTIWVGTNNGLIKVTKNSGKTWDDASISNIPNVARAEVLYVEPSHLVAAEAYAAIDLHRIGDYAPYFYRTRDYGKTWTKIIDGIATAEPSGSFARVIRNDTKKAGLLFAGTESRMYVSFDDGDHWQTLMQHLPVTSYRDMTIKNNDLLVSTYGRGFWVIDDYSMLRQMTPAIAAEPAHLFKPGDAWRVRRNVGADTPFPPEVPHALNPPEGVQLDYWLAAAPSGPVSLDVLDSSGAVVRHMSSVAEASVGEAARPPHPNFWIEPPEALPANAGTNRAHWDLRYDAPAAVAHSFEINANPGLTPTSPEGPVAVPGTYTLKLSAGGHAYSQTVMVHPDTRSPVPTAAIRAQHALQMKMYDGLKSSYAAYTVAVALRDAVRGALSGAPSSGDVATRGQSLAAQLDTLIGLQGGGRGFGGQPPRPNLRSLNGTFSSQLTAQDLGDIAPTSATLAGFAATCKDLQSATTVWERVKGPSLAQFNSALTAAGRPTLPAPTQATPAPKC
jgi:photosystem II stability/assembly factor-like uncharacterized protein